MSMNRVISPRRPPLATVWLAVPGGGALAGCIGVFFGLSTTVPELIHSPVAEGGTGSVGLTLIAFFVGFFVGDIFGSLGGLLLAASVTALWLLRFRTWTVAVVSGSIVAVATVVFTVTFFESGWRDLQTLSVASLGATLAFGGAILLAWAGEVRAGNEPGCR